MLQPEKSSVLPAFCFYERPIFSVFGFFCLGGGFKFKLVLLLYGDEDRRMFFLSILRA